MRKNGPPSKGFPMLHCRSFSSFSVFSFLKYFIPANKAPPIANVMAKDFQETGPGFKGAHGVSAALPFWGPDDLGGGGIAVSRGRLPRQQPAHHSPCLLWLRAELPQQDPHGLLPWAPNPESMRQETPKLAAGSCIIQPARVTAPP